jgi:hypothetical protein
MTATIHPIDHQSCGVKNILPNATAILGLMSTFRRSVNSLGTFGGCQVNLNPRPDTITGTRPDHIPDQMFKHSNNISVALPVGSR